MPKRLIKQWMPDSHTIRSNRCISLFGNLLHDPNLWHLNRRSVSGGVAVGLFMTFVPVPFQMFFAAASYQYIESDSRDDDDAIFGVQLGASF